jgi:pullulanase
MNADILIRKGNAFVLWRVANTIQPPALVIGELLQGAPVSFINEQHFVLQQDGNHPDLWFINADQCQLTDGWVYHYWFEVSDAAVGRPGLRIRITDPTAYMVNWQLLAVKPNDPHYTSDDAYPASIIKYKQGQLIACDAGGEELLIPFDANLQQLSPNNSLVIYELPTAWARIGNAGEWEIGTGSFSDVTALIDMNAGGGNFADLAVVQPGRSYLSELGVTALELLPPADSFYNRDWGYDTTNFFAPDFDLGNPAAYSWSAANRDLQTLTMACHVNGIRFFMDSVMAFSKQNPYLAAAPANFFIMDPGATPSDPDAHNSRGNAPGDLRYGYGSTLFRYAALMDSYDPVSGGRGNFYPARQLMKAALIRWMNDFRIDGIRIDSVENVANWDFVQEYKDLAWQVWKEQHPQDGGNHFLVVGEELSEPMDLLRENRLNGLWHEQFKTHIRSAILGQSAGGEPSFEWTIRKAIDCRNFGFTDLSQAIIYLTSHDVEGPGNERLYNFLSNHGITDTEKRIKLAFACLLTAAGIPMILAGEEFADQHDLFDRNGNVDQQGGKQADPVNFSRLSDDWRSRVKEYTARLIACRTGNAALSVNDTGFIHLDFGEGKRVMAWQRGVPGSSAVVIVVANFSDYGTPDPTHPSAEYIVNNWPATPPGMNWHEVTQGYAVGPGWAGREPICPWEAKVYELIAES